MKTILLLRHAKSSWKVDGVDDIDRPLNKRGRRAAKAIARSIVEAAPTPGQILCSPAKRTRETLELIQPAFAAPVPIRFEKGVYLASAPVLLRRLRRLSESIATVMVVGHNPGMETLALGLSDGDDGAARRELASKFPTGAFAVVTSDVEHWHELGFGCGRLERFIRPKEIDGD